MYTTLIFKPLYNGLVGIMDLLPWIDVGIAVIIFTVIVKFLLYPLSRSSLLTQVRMKEVEPEINKLKQQYASNRQEQALKIMALYKERNIKPFSGILLLFIQLPILFALISVLYKIIPEVQPQYLYSFVSVPIVDTMFLGFVDLTQKSIVLALLVGIVQFLQMHLSPAMRQHKDAGQHVGNDLASQLQHSMGKQMKYTLPVLAFVSVYWLIPVGFPKAASVIAVYWITTSIFTIFQELYIRKKLAPNNSLTVKS